MYFGRIAEEWQSCCGMLCGYLLFLWISQYKTWILASQQTVLMLFILPTWCETWHSSVLALLWTDIISQSRCNLKTWLTYVSSRLRMSSLMANCNALCYFFYWAGGTISLMCISSETKDLPSGHLSVSLCMWYILSDLLPFSFWEKLPFQMFKKLFSHSWAILIDAYLPKKRQHLRMIFAFYLWVQCTV